MKHTGKLTDNELEEEEELPPPTPIWKRKGVLMLVGVSALALFFIFMHSGTKHQEPPVSQANAISVSVPWDHPAWTNPAPTPQASDQAPAPPKILTAFVAPNLKTTNIKSDLPGNHPAVVSYPVKLAPPKEPPPPPVEPSKTGLKFATATLPGAKASPAIDDTYLLMPGLLPFVLDVAIDSSLPGPLLGHLPGPVYSPKGTLLMEAGTQVIGKYESLSSHGVERLHAVSAYAHTPNGIWIPLSDQPLADDLGRTGLQGTVDHHYIARFGGAVLLDLSQNALQILQANVAKGGSTYLNINGSDQLANQILQSTINIPATFTKNQGSMIAIWLTEPISFSDSYRVRVPQ